MPTCSNCGFELGQQPPPRCPRCAAAVELGGGPPDVGAPPEFGGAVQGKGVSGQTLYGLPELEDQLTTPMGGDEAPAPGPGSFAPPQAPPPPGPPPAGPPAVGTPAAAVPPPPSVRVDRDAAGPAEFDFGAGGGGPALQLDIPGKAPPPSQGGGIDLPAPAGQKQESPGGFDLRAPRTAQPRGGGLDLPAPAPGRQPRRAGRAPIPPPPPAGGMDLPAPASRGAPRAPGGIDLPVPAAQRQAQGGIDLPLPSPGRNQQMPGVPDLDLPQPVNVDLPAPSGADLPAPVGLDLPQPTDLDLPQPADLDLEPAHHYLEPAKLELEPAALEVEPAGMDVQPHDGNLPGLRTAHAGAGGAAAVPTARAIDEHVDARRSPTPREVDGPAVSRGVLYGGAAILLLAALGAGLFYSGIFDPEFQENGQGTIGQKGGGGEGGAPAGPAAERSDEVLGKLAADTPSGYAEAMAASQAAGDRVGQAEAALLLHLRYGPDPVLAGQASALLSPYASGTEPFVLRVVGLDALAGGKLPEADKALQGEEPRTRLYRGFLRLAQGRPQDAVTEADAVLAADATNVAALHLRHAARIELDAASELDALGKSVSEHPDHPGLAELMVEGAIASGHLARAREHMDKLTSSNSDNKAYRARLLTLAGRVAAATGDHPAALVKYEEALTLAPNAEPTQLARVRSLVAARDTASASVAASEAAQAHPGSIEAALLKVEVAILTGDRDKAMELIDGYAKSLADRPEIPVFRGQVHAMRAELEEGKAAFAAALKIDPAFVGAPIAEAEMLGAARQTTEAVAGLDKAYKQMQTAGVDSVSLGKLLVTKADLLVNAGQVKAAIAALDAALKVLPTHNDAQVARGTLRLNTGDYGGGKKDLEEVYTRTRGYPGLTAPLGRIFVREGRIEELAELVGDRADHPKAPADVKLVGARLRLAQARVDDAKNLADQVLAVEPNNWEGHLLMSMAFLDGGDPQAALQQIGQATPKNPSAEVYLVKGKILEYNGKHEEARPVYAEAIRIDPNLHEARFLYGRLLAYAGAGKQAIAELKAVVKATNQFPAAWLNLARAQREVGEAEDALINLDKAITADPNLYEAYYLKGRLLYDKNITGKAAAAFEKAVAEEAASQQWYPDAWMYMGRARAKAGNKAGAKAAFQKFLEIAPANHPSRPEAERQTR